MYALSLMAWPWHLKPHGRRRDGNLQGFPGSTARDFHPVPAVLLPE